jgi:hypothetical protein
MDIRPPHGSGVDAVEAIQDPRSCNSWERRTNEITNALIRTLHPKQSSCADIG